MSSSKLRNASIVPYSQKDIKLIERMRWLAARCVESFRRQPYPERLDELKLSSMQRHSPHATLITVCKLFHGYLNLPVEDFFKLPTAIFTLPGETWLLLNVRLDGGIDCLQCLVSRVAWMPTCAPFSLTLVDPTPFIFCI